jgi:predicted transcriptional regulator
MTTVSLELPDETAADLARLAERLGTTVEKLAAVGVSDLISRDDGEFSQVVQRVLSKNKELYKRLEKAKWGTSHCVTSSKDL